MSASSSDRQEQGPTLQPLEGRLARLGIDGARAAFHAGLRARFLAEGSAAKNKSQLENASRRAGSETMGSEPPRAFESQLRRRVGVLQARPQFQRDLRERFLRSAAVPRSVSRPGRPRALRRLAVSAAAIAALALVAFLLREDPHWTAARLDGPLAFAGRNFVPGEEAQLTRAIATAEGAPRVETQDSKLALALGPGLVIEIQPKTRLTLARAQDLGQAAPWVMSLEAGEVYLKTSAGWAGQPIVVRTPESDVHVHGTSLGVLAYENGTCVCVAEGQVEVVRGAQGSPSACVRRQVAQRTSCFAKHDDAALTLAAFPAPGSADPAMHAHIDDLLGFHAAR